MDKYPEEFCEGLYQFILQRLDANAPCQNACECSGGGTGGDGAGMDGAGGTCGVPEASGGSVMRMPAILSSGAASACNAGVAGLTYAR